MDMVMARDTVMDTAMVMAMAMDTAMGTRKILKRNNLWRKWYFKSGDPVFLIGSFSR